MSKTSHIHRRGNTLYFRLSVPDRFRKILKVTQFNQSLHSQDRKNAIPLAYALASEAKTLFLNIDAMLDDNFTDDEIRAAVAECDRLDNGADGGSKKGFGNSLQKIMSDKKHSIAIDALKDRHQEELELMRTKTQAEAFVKITSLTLAPNRTT